MEYPKRHENHCAVRYARTLALLVTAATLSPQSPMHGQTPSPPMASQPAMPSSPAEQRPPTFRSGIDLVQVDVSVMDARRRPIRGLTAADFTMLEEGQPRPIQTFVEIDVPRPATPTAAWDRQVPRDVTTNQQHVARVVVLVVDDSTLAGADVWAMRKVKEVGRSIIDDLGPGDLAAVLYTIDNQKAQGLTSDRHRLLAAIETPPAAPGGFGPALADPERGWCECGLCGFKVLTGVARALQPLPHLNKTVVYISQGVVIANTSSAGAPCRERQVVARNETFRQAQLSNVRIHAMDPTGLTGARGIRQNLELLRTLAETTGGRAVVQNNDPERDVPAIMEESRSYYLIGFAPAADRDGKEHRIDVKVNRRGAAVRARHGYYADPPATAKKDAPAGTASTDTLDATITGLLAKGDMPLRATAAAFAGAGNEPLLAVVLRVEEAATAASQDVPAPPGVAARPAAAANAQQDREARTDTSDAEPIDIIATTYDVSGKEVGTRRLTLGMPGRGPGAGGEERGIEALIPLPVKPGRFEVRLGARTADARSASVFVEADVPNFARAPLSLSGLVLSAMPPMPAGPTEAFKDLMPIVPTTRRAFGATDRVTAFLRVYQAGARSALPAVLAVRIVDARGKLVLEQTTNVAAGAFAEQRRADCQFDLPIQALATGEYLLTVNVKAGETRAQRAVRFERR